MADTDTTFDEPVVKRFMILNRKAPHGTIYAQEGLEMVLIAAMFDQDVHLTFIDDGVFQIRKNQDPPALEIKDYCKTYRALEGYGVEKVYVERESMEERGLTADDFIIPVTVLPRSAVAEMMNEMDVVLSA